MKKIFEGELDELRKHNRYGSVMRLTSEGLSGGMWVRVEDKEFYKLKTGKIFRIIIEEIE